MAPSAPVHAGRTRASRVTRYALARDRPRCIVLLGIVAWTQRGPADATTARRAAAAASRRHVAGAAHDPSPASICIRRFRHKATRSRLPPIVRARSSCMCARWRVGHRGAADERRPAQRAAGVVSRWQPDRVSLTWARRRLGDAGAWRRAPPDRRRRLAPGVVVRRATDCVSDRTNPLTSRPARSARKAARRSRSSDADGNNPRQLTASRPAARRSCLPGLDRDGRFVAFSVFDGARNNGVWLVSVETGETRPAAQRRCAVITSSRSRPTIRRSTWPAAIRSSRASRSTSSRDRLWRTRVDARAWRGRRARADGLARWAPLVLPGLTTASQLWAQPIAPDGTGRGAARALTTDTSRRNSLPAVSPDGARRRLRLDARRRDARRSG